MITWFAFERAMWLVFVFGSGTVFFRLLLLLSVGFLLKVEGEKGGELGVDGVKYCVKRGRPE